MWSHIWKVFRIQKGTQKAWVTYVTLQCWGEKWTLMYLIHCIWESLGNNSLACTPCLFPPLFHITQSNSHSKLDHYVPPSVHDPYLMLFLSRVKHLPFSSFPLSLPVCRTLSFHLDLPWTAHSIRRRQWHPTPVLLPGKSHGRRSLEGCSPWGSEQSDTTERLHFHVSLSCIGEGNGNPLQCFCLENPRDGAAWWAAVYGVAQSQTRLKWLSSSSSSTTLSAPPHPSCELRMCVHAQSYLNLCDSMDRSQPGSSVHGISQARILEWVAIFISSMYTYIDFKS